MKSSEEFVANARLRRARSLKGWSQADLAEQVGTSFEMVSRWERGVTVPSFYYRERLCAALGQTAEDLGLVRDHNGSITPPPSPLVFLASSHVDAEKPVVSYLKTALQERGITLWSSRQLGRQGSETARTALREAIRSAQVILVIISPEARTSRHVHEALELASRYQRPVCGVWIEGERWHEDLPNDEVKLADLIDARTSDSAVLIGEIATALERLGLTSLDSGMLTPDKPIAAATLSSAVLPPHLEPTIPPHQRVRRLSSITAGLLIGLAVLVIAGGILGSISLLAHFGLLGAHSGATATGVRGGTWTNDIFIEPDSLLPNGSVTPFAPMIDNALYLPLFYGDAQGVIHTGAASEVPTLGNGGISADATSWTFHLRPHLVWSDGAPYDARDVNYTWQLWRNPAFGASNTLGLNLITEASVSADHLSITFHLKQPFAPFLSYWVDGFMAPLPAHHFRGLAPQAIKKSPDNLVPTVTSGPFLLSEYVPGDHDTLVRNPHYYLASQGMPYLDKVVFRFADEDTILQDLQEGTITSAWFLDPSEAQDYQRLTHYTLITPPASAAFEALYFNFHNLVLASHPEVRQAMAKAIDHQALIQQVYHGLATPLCTDHGSFYHPGYETNAPCSEFNATAANKLLDDHGWVRGPDGVRAKGGLRLEFEYSTTANNAWRSATEAIVQRDFQAIGIKLDIQNYPAATFFASFLPAGKASPPTGAVAGSYDIAEFMNTWYYDPDDSSLLSCEQIPPNGYNVDFYCNPALDALYRQELATADSGLRQQLFGQIHQIYLSDFPFITLFGAPNIAMLRKGTHNYQISDVEGGTINIWEWWCDGGKC